MKNHKNLCFCCSGGLYWGIIIFITILFNGSSSSNPNNNVRYDQIMDYVSAPYQEAKNVTCISHETTFTCDCLNSDMHMNLPPLYGHIYQISIRNCPSLEVSSNFLHNTLALRTVLFENVDNLVLHNGSLSFPSFTSNMPLVLRFNQVQIEKISSHAISGNIQEISFTNGSIGSIKAFAITTRSEDNILKFDFMYIDGIERMAFKKFSIDRLEITNSVITSNLPSESFYELKISDMVIRNVTFAEVHTNAFLIDEISKLTIQNNQFEAINGEWLSTYIKSYILIENNQFNLTSSIAFKGIKQHKDYKKSERIDLRFLNNKIRLINDPYPLEFNKAFNLIITNLHYENQFPCAWKDKNMNFFKTYPDMIHFQSRQYSNQYYSLSKIILDECQTSSILAYVIGGSIGLLVLMVIMCLTIWYCITKRNQNRDKNMSVIVPEPRTYRETQIVYQIENAGLLKTDL